MRTGSYRWNMGHKPNEGRKVVRFPCPACGQVRGLGLALKLDDRPGLHRECRYCKHIEPVMENIS